MLPAKRKRLPSIDGSCSWQLKASPCTPSTSRPPPTTPRSLNGDKGFCKLPRELALAIVSFYQSIEDFTRIQEGVNLRRASKRPHPTSVLSSTYCERSDALRALSETCTVYRSIFLPLLWERLEICFPSRTHTGVPFHKAVGEAMLRKCKGLLQNQDLAAMVRIVNVVFTRHKMEVALPAFARCLRFMPNVRTIHVLDANPQMPNAIKTAFENLILPRVRTLIIPGSCHELLKCCPEVERVWCIQGTGNKLVTVISGFCKQVTEVKGFRCEEDTASMKRLVKGIPNLRVLELNSPCSEVALQCLKMLVDLSRVDVRIPRQGAELDDESIQRTVKLLRSILEERSSTKERYLRLVHRSFIEPEAAMALSNIRVSVDVHQYISR